MGRIWSPLRVAISSSSWAMRCCCWWRMSSRSRTSGVRRVQGCQAARVSYLILRMAKTSAAGKPHIIETLPRLSLTCSPPSTWAFPPQTATRRPALRVERSAGRPRDSFSEPLPEREKCRDNVHQPQPRENRGPQRHRGRPHCPEGCPASACNRGCRRENEPQGIPCRPPECSVQLGRLRVAPGALQSSLTCALPKFHRRFSGAFAGRSCKSPAFSRSENDVSASRPV